MRLCLTAILVSLTATAFAQTPVPDVQFESVANFLKLPPDVNLGEAAGVAVNAKGNVFVFSRSGSSSGPAYGAAAAQLLEFGPDGRYIREIGRNLYSWSFAHGVRVDRDDNVWATDKGSDMVVRFNHEGHVTLTLGRRTEASALDARPWETNRTPPYPPMDGMFRQPTEVAWDSQGNIFVSDGYINSRVAKFDKSGNFVKSWGRPGTGAGEFTGAVHSIASDAKDQIYVADRGGRRIQVFDAEGTHLRDLHFDQVPLPADYRPVIGIGAGSPQLASGAPWAVCITPGPNQVLFAADTYRVYKMSLDGTVIGTIGRPGKELKQFGWIHEIACPSEHEIYVAELLNWRVQKLILH